ncbi:glycoside hydrolase family 18 protein, partial [Plenodomus tracheiphilus IPT5]
GAYYPSWRIYRDRKPSDLKLSLLTHVYYAFARISEDGKICHADIKADTQIPVDGTSGALRALVKLRNEQHPHLNIVLSIGGGSGSKLFPEIAADPMKRANFCRSALDFVDRFELDGIDIDWEHPDTASKGEAFKQLLLCLRAYLPGPRYKITAALPAGQWCLRHIDLSTLLSGPHATVDHINIMAYDFAGSWTNGESGHHAALHAPSKPHNTFAQRSVSSVTEYLVNNRKVDPAKIVIGIPAYGRSFLGVKGPGEKFSGCGGVEGTFEYRDLPLPGTKTVIDRQLGAASCHSRETGNWVSYDTPETVALKSQYIAQAGLGGVFFWTGTADADEDEKSLIATSSRV